MSAPSARREPGRTELRIALVLRVGVFLASFLILAGLALSFVHHPGYVRDPATLAEALAPATARHSPAEVLDGLARGSGKALVALGLIVLLATPFVRVGLSILVFAEERDWTFVGLTALVLLLLALSLALGHAELS